MQGTIATFPPSAAGNVSFWAKTSAANTTGTYFVIGDSGTPSNLGIFFFYFSSSGNIRAYSSSSNVFQTPYSANTWYHIELRNINYTTKTYDIWINNTLGQANFPFRSQSTVNLDRIYLYNLGSNVTSSYDEIIVGGVPVALAPTGGSVSCPTDSNGTASVNPSGGTPPYAYSWSNGGTSASISNLLPGTYYVTVTDSLGCMGMDSAIVSAPVALAATALPTDAFCNGDSSGSIDLTVSGGTAPYTFAWNNGDTNEDPMGLPAGNYSVVITDSLGCLQTDSATVTEPTTISLNPVVTNLLCNGDSTGAIDLSPSGGVPGFNYTWSTSATTEDLTGLAAGNYSVFVTDSNGCSLGDVFTITEPAALALSGTATPDNGTGNGAIDLMVSGGTAGYTYAWSNSATTEDISGLSPGTYTVTVTDANGCTSMQSFVIDLVIAVDPALVGPGVQVTPNPTQGQVKVTAGLQAPGLVRFQLSDLRGRILFQKEVDASGTSLETFIDLESLSSGVYLLGVEAAGQQTWTRVLRD